MEKHRPVIIFDAECGFCSFWASWIARRDRKQQFYFSPQESNFARKILGEYNIDSVVLIENGKVYIKAAATKRILSHLNQFYLILSWLLKLFPEKYLDKIYDFLAKNRKKLGFRKCDFQSNILNNITTKD